MPLADRDLCWTEWVRENQKELATDIQRLEDRWRTNPTSRTPSDRLRAQWIGWLLTTTVHNLRDRATRALYWFGRGDASCLFEQTANASNIDDPYVFERLLAASYGVAMATPCEGSLLASYKKQLANFARTVFQSLFQEGAPNRTTHILTREYGRRLVELAVIHNPRLFSKQEIARVRPPYSDGGRIAWQEVDADQDSREADSPFRIDFENYTLGRLTSNRRNYDMDHLGYRMVRAQVLWRVRQLGWSPERFEQIDRHIEGDFRYFNRSREGQYKIDRYGKKYSWIAYLELDGWLQDQGSVPGDDVNSRTSDVDIDPSFPSPTPVHDLVLDDLLGEANLSLEQWIKEGPIPKLTPYFRQTKIMGEVGPWIMVDGYIARQDEFRGRRLFSFVRSFLVNSDEAKGFVACLKKQSLGGRWLPEKPACSYTFAGEIPWCDTFPGEKSMEIRFVVKERQVKVRRKQACFYLDGVPVAIGGLHQFLAQISTAVGGRTLTDDELARIEVRHQLVETDETRKEFRKFRVIVPAHDFDWELRNVEDVSVRGITLAKYLAKKAGLIHLPQTHDLQTKDGVSTTALG